MCSSLGCQNAPENRSVPGAVKAEGRLLRVVQKAEDSSTPSGG